MTANEFTNVKDIKGNFLFTKDGYIISYLRVGFISIDLLSGEEKAGKERPLTASFGNDRKDFVYFTLPREIDLDRYTGELKERHRQELSNIGRRHLLAEMLRDSNRITTSGINHEHQHHVKIWRYLGNDRIRAENELLVRTREFKSRYISAGIPADILEEADILKLCNLFGNPTQAVYEQVPESLRFEPYVVL